MLGVGSRVVVYPATAFILPATLFFWFNFNKNSVVYSSNYEVLHTCISISISNLIIIHN